MTEIEPFQGGATATVAQRQSHMQTAAVQRLGDWAAAASAAYQVAEKLVETSFVPVQFKGKAVEATAAILAGAECGLSPMASLKSFDVIQGVAAPRALTLRAIVQSQGHEMVLDESTEARCKMRGRRRGESEWTKVTWTIDRARNLGLASKSNWKQQPAAMLVARATGELARLIAADAILGIGYTIEEVADGADVTISVDAAPKGEAPTTGKRTMQRKVEPPADDPSGADTRLAAESTDPVNPADEPILLNTSGKLAKALYATLRDKGIDKDGATALYADVTGREVTSSKELTEDEARAVLKELDSWEKPVVAEVVAE